MMCEPTISFKKCLKEKLTSVYGRGMARSGQYRYAWTVCLMREQIEKDWLLQSVGEKGK